MRSRLPVGAPCDLSIPAGMTTRHSPQSARTAATRLQASEPSARWPGRSSRPDAEVRGRSGRRRIPHAGIRAMGARRPRMPPNGRHLQLAATPKSTEELFSRGKSCTTHFDVPSTKRVKQSSKPARPMSYRSMRLVGGRLCMLGALGGAGDRFATCRRREGFQPLARARSAALARGSGAAGRPTGRTTTTFGCTPSTRISQSSLASILEASST